MTQIQQTRVQVAKKGKGGEEEATSRGGLRLPRLPRGRRGRRGSRRRWRSRGKGTRIGRFMRNVRAKGLRLGRKFKRSSIGRGLDFVRSKGTQLGRNARAFGLRKTRGIARGARALPGVARAAGPRALQTGGNTLSKGKGAFGAIARSPLGKTVGRFLPGANIAIGGAITASRLASGDYGGALLSAGSMIPGPIGWAFLGAEMIGPMLSKVGKAKFDNAVAADDTRRKGLAEAPSTAGLSAGEREALVQGSRIQDAGGSGSLNGLGSQINDPLGLRSVPGLSEGGVVSSATRALIGEGGEPEVVVPQSKLGEMFGNLIKQVGGMLGGVTRGFLQSLPTPDQSQSGVQSELSQLNSQFGGLGGYPVLRMFSGGKVPNLLNDIGNKIKGLLGSIVNGVLGGPAYAGGMGIGPGSPFGGGSPYGGGGGAPTAITGLTPGKWGPLLDLIAGKESGGNYEAMYPSTTLPGATKMTIAEVARVATGAVGKYQQLPRFLIGRAKAAGLNPATDLYSPQNQDLIVTKVNIGQNRRGDKWLRGEISDEAFMDGLAYEFASLPDAYGRFKYPGQSSSMSPGRIRQALQKVKGGGYSQNEMQSSGNAHTAMAAAATAPGSTVSGAGKTGGGKVSGFPITSYYGPRWGRLHGGVDVGTPVGTGLSLSEEGEIVYAGRHGRPGKGYGNMIDAWLPGSGVQIRLAHLSQIVKRTGKFKAGEMLGKTGGAKGDPGAGSSTGPHLHFEADRTKGGSKYGGSGNPLPYASKIVLGSAKPANSNNNKGGQALSPNDKPRGGGGGQIITVPMPIPQPVPVQVRVPVPVGAKKQPKLYGIDPFSGRYGAI